MGFFFYYICNELKNQMKMSTHSKNTVSLKLPHSWVFLLHVILHSSSTSDLIEDMVGDGELDASYEDDLAMMREIFPDPVDWVETHVKTPGVASKLYAEMVEEHLNAPKLAPDQKNLANQVWEVMLRVNPERRTNPHLLLPHNPATFLLLCRLFSNRASEPLNEDLLEEFFHNRNNAYTPREQDPR